MPTALRLFTLAATLAATGCTATVHPVTGLEALPAASRQPAPPIAGTDLEGRPVALADYRGSVVVINIWGSWCSACRAEAAGLEQVYEKYRTQGVHFLGINTRDADPTVAQRFETTHRISFPSLYDPDGTELLKFPKGSFNPQTLPNTLIIDPNGHLAARAMRAIGPEDLESALTSVIAEK